MGFLRASKEFGVPICSLRRRLKGTNVYAIESNKFLGRPMQSLPANLEEELVTYILQMDRMMYGLTTIDVRKMAFELAEKNNIPPTQHRFNLEKKIAGWDWLAGFRNRHPILALRAPEPTSMARATGFNKKKVGEFFELLKEVYDANKLSPDRIYNVDETGLTNVQGRSSKVFSSRGKRQVGCLKSAERGTNVTMVCGMNVTGHFVPPAFVIPRKRVRSDMAENAPPGCLFLHQDKGWMDSSQFLKYLKHFVQHTKPSQQSKVLLILDGHQSHKSLEAVDFCRENGIILLCLPPHCTHKLQPLDVSFFKSFNTYYDKAVENWMRSNYGRVLTIHQIPQLAGQAFGISATASIARNGFRAAGIYPLNDLIFSDADFVVDVPLLPVVDSQSSILPAQITPFPNFVKPTNRLSFPKILTTVDIVDLDVQPGPSTSDAHLQSSKRKNSTKNEISTESLLAPGGSLPKRHRRARTSSAEPSTAPHSPSVTNRPIMIITTENPSAATGSSAIVRNRKRPFKPTAVESPALDASVRNHKRSLKNGMPSSKPSTSAGAEDDPQCIYCSSFFLKSKQGETWVKCQKCLKWAHKLCADYISGRFVCDLCA